MTKFLDLGRQYRSIQASVDEAVRAVIEAQAFVGGPFVERFEEEFAAFVGRPHCVGVGNGTDAIEIALESLALPPGSEVIVPANTFIATSEAVTRAGHQVVFCDCDPETFTISAETVRPHLTERTRALIPVHLYGQPCEMGPLMDLTREWDLRVIEDCAQAHGAADVGRTAGTFGDLATFSFYPGKNLGAYGDAGAIVTGEQALADRCRMIANHGRIDKHDHLFEGRNSRLDGLQAAILSAKLPHLERWTEARRWVASEYRRALDGVDDLVLPAERPGVQHVYHLFVVRSSRRDELRLHLGERGIQTGIHYPVALPDLKAYAHLAWPATQMSASRYAGQILSLPMGEHLSPEDIDQVVSAVRDF
ncbi:MAG TPA: DegT/DnrJ/EryC1/StrS family aminotransferase [Rhodothermales bacterium]|nr:DegT/DnrJ/EryC1/StrS family aminotransferase [Rhodothermales bacterium]